MAETSRDQPRTVPDGAVALFETKFDQTSLATVRSEISRCGKAHGLVDLKLSNFVLAVNEITTNAVRYAGGGGHLQLWRAEDMLLCVVIDHGPGIPRRRLAESHTPRPGHIGGRGLWLPRQICDSVDITTDRTTGTSVMLKFALPTDS